jgi:hypothetical protein
MVRSQSLFIYVKYLLGLVLCSWKNEASYSFFVSLPTRLHSISQSCFRLLIELYLDTSWSRCSASLG